MAQTTATNSAAAPTSAKGNNRGLITAILIILCIALGYILYIFLLGNPSNFEGNDPENAATNFLGTMFKGGIAIVPLLIGMFVMSLTFFVERILTISTAKGKGNMAEFVRKIKASLNKGDIEGARKLCAQQRGSLGNVVLAGLHKYSEMSGNTELDKDQRVLAIQKEIEEATTLELPMLERNLVVLSTLASVATLVGLLGTVFGMIKAFAALAQAGSPDAVKLAEGISEALVNTALGIGTSALAIVFYNYFTTTIDGMTYNIDEAGYSITQTFAANHKETHAGKVGSSAPNHATA